ncbi:MAG: 4-(cytidine 5'-diphospho)-2-C-methyl-D-erythritol kinase [Actinomycetota bacterium]|nr:4-(cytidine 5'-diphospho)-2-C-methyl-D-erythritol kinase [Actinomycetota bacterium]
MTDPVQVRAPAKLNLHLAVGPRRADGFHELVTVYQAVSLYDEVTASPSTELSVRVRGEGAADVPAGEDNLAARAALALAELAGIEPMVALDVSKAIPVAGGMAGGSADAAAALVACDALWQVGLSRPALFDLAAGLGSDVPFALTGGTALGTGRGDRLSPVLAAGRWHWVLALSETGLATPQVYRELDRRRRQSPGPAAGRPDRLINALRSGQPGALGQELANDLQTAAVALRPDLARTLEAGAELGAAGAVVSGSGPTCAFLAGSAEDAVRLAAALAGAGVCRTTRVAAGPVPGARLITPGGPAE